MSKMGYGYGSEFQLLRYLGHHRNYLDNQIKAKTGSNSPIQWYDHPINRKTTSYDAELKDIECFKDELFFEELRVKWGKFWPQRGNSQNWDAVFRQNDTWYFVEAKAHIGEAHQKCSAKEHGGRPKILQAFISTCNGNKTLAEQWLESDCYQLANRLAFIHFCKENGLKVKICLICFISGYNADPTKEVINNETWNELWIEEFRKLSLNDKQKKDILQINIDCLKG